MMGENGGDHTLSLCMIVKDAEKELPTLWASVQHIVDEWIVVDTGSTDKTVEVAKGLGAKVFEKGDEFCDELTEEQVKFFKSHGVDAEVGEKIFHFGRARTFSFEQATQKYLLWLDADDVLEGSLKMKEIMLNNLDPKKPMGLHLLYQYETDPWGTPVVEHYRERVFPNTRKFKWTGRIHEIVIPEVETQYIRVAPDDTKVLHNITDESRSEANLRNLKAALLNYFEQLQKGEPDPRTLKDLGDSYRLRNPEFAEKFYKMYVDKSGWDEEQCLVSTRLCDLALKQGSYHKALDWAFKALRFKPDFPMAYSTIAECYFAMDLRSECEVFAKQALQMEQPETLVMVNQKHNEFTPLLILAMLYFEMRRLKECEAVVAKALRYEPQHETLKSMAYTCQRVREENAIVKSFGEVTKYLKDEGELVKAREILKFIPASHISDPRLKTLRKEMEKEIDIDQDLMELDQDRLVMLSRAMKVRGSKTFHVAGLSEKTIGRLKDLGFEEVQGDEKADAVIFAGFLESAENPKGALQEATKWTHSKGRIFVFTHPDKSRWVHAFSTDSFGKLVDDAGLTPWNLFNVASNSLYAEILPGKFKTDKSRISFVCGPGWDEWGPLSIHEGIGGSEEAVIYMSRELVTLGHSVEVYNNISTPVVCEGVRWRNYSDLAHAGKMETCILWRVPHFIEDYKLDAEKFYLWMHDVPRPEWFTDERLERIEKIIVLSEYHKNLLPVEIQSKAFVSQNGVFLPQFEKDVERNPKKVIYTSSYDRGLEHLLGIWLSVHKEVPDAELHIFYGWGTFDNLCKEDSKQQWKSKMIEMMKSLPNVTDHGKVGQEELAKEFLSSGIYAYPCHFEEISCISAMKAQVAGCVPLTTDYGALAETNLLAYCKVPGNPKKDELVRESFKSALIGLLQEPLDEGERAVIRRKARECFNWFRVAKQWSKEINP